MFSQLHEEELLQLIQQLPDGYRIVFNMYAIEGYSHAEISALLGVQESTSRSQLVKAQLGGNTGQKIVVSDAEEDDEGSESEEEGSSEEDDDVDDEETTQTLTLETGDGVGDETGVFMQAHLVLQHHDLSVSDIKGEVVNLHDVSPEIKEVDGLDDMDDLEEESEEESEDDDED